MHLQIKQCTSQEELVSANKDKNDFFRDLVKKCGEGDSNALQEFFEHFSEDMYNFPLKIFHLDEDAASDFYLYAFDRLKDGKRFRSFQGRSSFRTWFYTVLRNLVIDWMRTIREFETVQVHSQDEHEHRHMIENAPAPVKNNAEEEVVELLHDKLLKLPVETSLLFKMSYIYYFDLNHQEIDYLSCQTGCTESEIMSQLLELRHSLAGKELQNIKVEDKITSLYVNIMSLQAREEKIELLIRRQDKSNPAILTELERLRTTIRKKRVQWKKLLQKKNNGHLIVRTPYRWIAEFMKMPESNISVQMKRILGKLRISNVG